VSFHLTLQDCQALSAFLEDLVRMPSPSTQEGQVALRLSEEMRKVGFAEVRSDRIGNVIGRIGAGHGPKLVFNGHMDTVEVGNPIAWTHEPYGAEIVDGVLYGRGACDMKGALAAMIYGAKLLNDAGIRLAGDLYVVGVVQEEPCEGLAMRVLVEEEGLRPDFVILGEPTNLHISRGQKGRMEMKVTVYGRTCHASMPERGENAIYAAARLIFGLELLSGQLVSDPFLGPGSLAVTQIESAAPSRNAVPDTCSFYIDRRLTLGETETKALAEVQGVIAREGVRADVEVTHYKATSYTGYPCQTRSYYPAWAVPEDSPLVKAVSRAVQETLGYKPRIGKWAFSTDGVYTRGIAGIPTIGFGPGDDQKAHTADEHIRLADVIKAAEAYAQIAVEVLGVV